MDVNLPQLPTRSRDAHKGDFGRVLIIAGSRNMPGAAVLAGMATLRSGAGLVTIACPREVQQTIAAGYPCYTTYGFPGNEEGVFGNVAEPELLNMLLSFDVLAVGPGLGRGKSVTKLVSTLLAKSKKPIVLDADGLNALAELSPEALVERGFPTVLTPHPGEFARLVGSTVAEVEHRREELARQFAILGNCIMLLKGHETIITDGARLARNRTGNPGMATGGSGDVLTGIVAALIGQGLDAFAAAQLGAFVHGRAGDLAADSLGEISLTARDLIDFLPSAFREVA